MIADIFHPIFTLITILVCFIRKKKAKLFRGFAPSLSPRHHPGPHGWEGGLQLPPDPQLQSFLALPRTDALIFFLYYPLDISRCFFHLFRILIFWVVWGDKDQ